MIHQMRTNLCAFLLLSALAVLWLIFGPPIDDDYERRGGL